MNHTPTIPTLDAEHQRILDEMEDGTLKTRLIRILQTPVREPPPTPPPLTAESLTQEARRRLDRAGWQESMSTPAITQALCRAYAEAMLSAPRRGLLLLGGTGCGKTMAAKAIWTRSRLVELCDPGEVQRLEEDEDLGRVKVHVILNDLGAEPEIRYRKNNDFVGNWLLRRHALWEHGHAAPVSITTNLPIYAQKDYQGDRPPPSIEGNYGQRVLSRILHMTIPITIHGPDRRQRITL